MTPKLRLIFGLTELYRFPTALNAVKNAAKVSVTGETKERIKLPDTDYTVDFASGTIQGTDAGTALDLYYDKDDKGGWVRSNPGSALKANYKESPCSFLPHYYEHRGHLDADPFAGLCCLVSKDELPNFMERSFNTRDEVEAFYNRHILQWASPESPDLLKSGMKSVLRNLVARQKSDLFRIGYVGETGYRIQDDWTRYIYPVEGTLGTDRITAQIVDTIDDPASKEPKIVFEGTCGNLAFKRIFTISQK